MQQMHSRPITLDQGRTYEHPLSHCMPSVQERQQPSSRSSSLVPAPILLPLPPQLSVTGPALAFNFSPCAQFYDLAARSTAGSGGPSDACAVISGPRGPSMYQTSAKSQEREERQESRRGPRCDACRWHRIECEQVTKQGNISSVLN